MLEPYARRSTYPHHGQRVVMGQRLMQAATDIFLGWPRIRGLDGATRDYYVRQFHDWSGVPATCPIGGATADNHGHSRTAGQ